MRKNFSHGTIDSRISENLDMEYSLTLIKYLSYSDKLGLDEEEIEDSVDEIGDFLTRTHDRKSNNKFMEKVANAYKMDSKSV